MSDKELFLGDIISRLAVQHACRMGRMSAYKLLEDMDIEIYEELLAFYEEIEKKQDPEGSFCSKVVESDTFEAYLSEDLPNIRKNTTAIGISIVSAWSKAFTNALAINLPRIRQELSDLSDLF